MGIFRLNSKGGYYLNFVAIGAFLILIGLGVVSIVMAKRSSHK